MTEEQQPIFGEQDLIVNTLETELTEIKKEITTLNKAIANKKAKVLDLVERQANLKKAIDLSKEKAGEEEEEVEEEQESEPVEEKAGDPY